MKIFFTAILLGSLISIVYYDFRYRKIHLFSILAVLISAGGYHVFTFAKLAFVDLLMNLSFLAINMVMIGLYFYIKEGKSTKILDYKIGLGDLLLWISLIPIFQFESFILAFIFSLIFALIIHHILKIFPEYQRKKTLPLAGLQSFFFAMIIFINLFTPSFL